MIRTFLAAYAVALVTIVALFALIVGFVYLFYLLPGWWGLLVCFLLLAGLAAASFTIDVMKEAKGLYDHQDKRRRG